MFRDRLHLRVAAALIALVSGCREPGSVKSSAVSAFATATPTNAADTATDPYLWLEDVTGDRAIAWVKEQNVLSVRELTAAPDFETTRQRLLAILDSKERIPGVAKHGGFYYNFWQDDKNPRGLWRRTTLDEYRKPSPDWEIVLDLDRLADDEKENWIWKGANVLEPDYDRCLVSLSRGGGDATVYREKGGKLSGGERQRLKLAIALEKNPRSLGVVGGEGADGLVAVPAPDATDSDLLKGNAFSSGKVAMAETHLWYTCCIETKNVKSLDAAIAPSYNGKITAKMHGDTFAIMAASQHPEEAFKVYTYMLGEGAADLYTIYGGLPARTSQQADFFKSLDEKFAPNKVNWQVFLDMIPYLDAPNHQLGLPNNNKSNTAWQTLGSDLQTNDKLDVDKRVADFITEWNAILAETGD